MGTMGTTGIRLGLEKIEKPRGQFKIHAKIRWNPKIYCLFFNL
jgi:hypothetical protein